MIMIMSPLNKKHAKGDQHSNDRRPTAETGESQVSQAEASPTQGSTTEGTQTDGIKIQEVEMSVTVPVEDSGAESGSNDHAEDTNP